MTSRDLEHKLVDPREIPIGLTPNRRILIVTAFEVLRDRYSTGDGFNWEMAFREFNIRLIKAKDVMHPFVIGPVNGQYAIFVHPENGEEATNYNLMHEFAHVVLGHRDWKFDTQVKELEAQYFLSLAYPELTIERLLDVDFSFYLIDNYREQWEAYHADEHNYDLALITRELGWKLEDIEPPKD